MSTNTPATRTGRAASLFGLAVIATAALAGCGTSDSTSSKNPATPATTSAVPAAAHNHADIAFATNMIPHHAQAVEMSRMAKEQAGSPQVKDLANRIEGAQQPEIDQMRAFLRAWGAPVPATNGGAMPGMDHSGHVAMSGMAGMMSEAQMRELSQARGTAFDTTFLKMMIAHHDGAVSMAQTELSQGQSPDANALAQRIIDAQRREITEMNGLLSLH
jgi:uncharacterized protein (DUF305 family)